MLVQIFGLWEIPHAKLRRNQHSNVVIFDRSTPLQRAVARCWLGTDGTSPFEMAVSSALETWDRTTTFVMLELGSGDGVNSVKLIDCAKQLMVRDVHECAQIPVYQMDNMNGIERSNVLDNAKAWTDASCECVFLAQSFYDEFHLPEKVNLLFSQASDSI